MHNVVAGTAKLRQRRYYAREDGLTRLPEGGIIQTQALAKLRATSFCLLLLSSKSWMISA